MSNDVGKFPSYDHGTLPAIFLLTQMGEF